jgi:hypothetical protein
VRRTVTEGRSTDSATTVVVRGLLAEQLDELAAKCGDAVEGDSSYHLPGGRAVAPERVEAGQ